MTAAYARALVYQDRSARERAGESITNAGLVYAARAVADARRALDAHGPLYQSEDDGSEELQRAVWLARDDFLAALTRAGIDALAFERGMQ